VRSARLVADDLVPTRNQLPPRWPGRFAVLDGARTYVRETPGRSPDAEPALYLHGLGGSSSNWTDLADLLAERLAGQAIDLPGFGRSEPAHSYSIAAFAHRVIRWIEYAGRGPVHLFGNSLGGAVAVRVAGTRPDLVRTLTLISPALPFLDPRRSAHSRMVPLVLLPMADRLAARRLATADPADLTRTVIDICFADPDRLPPERFAEAVEETRVCATLPWHSTAYLRSLRGLVGAFVRAYLPGDGSLWRIASRITASTLVLGGRHDMIVDVRVAGQTANIIRDSRLWMFDGVGHVAQMEAPRLVARAVLGMLDEVGALPALAPPRVPLPARSPALVPAALPVAALAAAGESAV